MPVEYKNWFIKRTIKEINKSREEGSGQTKAAHQNDPETRALLGMQRDVVPGRLRRFT